jgi:hypothetical protein
LRARLIVTTIVAGGLAPAIGGTMALADKPTAPDSSKYPDLRTVVPDHLNLVNQQQNENCGSRTGCEHRRRSVGFARRARARFGADDDRDPGDPLERVEVPLRDAAEAE